MSDEFYIGWEAKAAPLIGKAVRRAIVVLLLLVSGLGVTLAAAQRMIGVSVFEWGTQKTFSGVLQTRPYPHLLVPRPGTNDFHTLQSVKTSPSPASSYHLVAPWKFGLDRAALAPLDGKTVSLRGALIYRGSQTMIETKPEWIVASTNTLRRAQSDVLSENLGRLTLVGEIVDSKCFLGVMNPGQLIPHRACAIRCISGGVPPLLLVRQQDRPPIYLLLVSAEGKPVNKQVLEFVAEPVEITGEVERQGELLILKSDPATYRRVK